jgi:hypothetical protein
LDSKNPVRTIRDTTLARARLNAGYIEFRNGDRLAGRVIGHVEAQKEPGLPAHLIIEADIDLGFPKVFRRDQIRVLPDWISRIVQRKLVDRDLPTNSVQLADGTTQSFRAFKWRAESLELLTDTGVIQHRLEQLAAIELATIGSWDDWQRQLAALSPTLDTPLIRLELAGGTVLTTSQRRHLPRTQGGEDSDRWFHLVQPAWSLDLLAVPLRQIRVQTYFAPTETPLGIVRPTASRHRSLLSQAWPAPRFNENLAGNGLRSEGRQWAWGMSVQAEHALDFDCPASARRLQTRLALDPAVGDGGAARARVEMRENKLFESQVLVGSRMVVDSGPLPLATGPARLGLVADAAVRDRPKLADPLEICDLVNWLEPIVEHDVTQLRREVEARYAASHPWLAGWTVDTVEAGNWNPIHRFDETDIERPCFRQLLALRGPLTLTRQIAVDSSSTTALLRFGRLAGESQAAHLEISVDGRRVWNDNLPTSTGPFAETFAIRVPLQATSGQPLELIVRLTPAAQNALVDWRGMNLIVTATDK